MLLLPLLNLSSYPSLGPIPTLSVDTFTQLSSLSDLCSLVNFVTELSPSSFPSLTFALPPPPPLSLPRTQPSTSLPTSQQASRTLRRQEAPNRPKGRPMGAFFIPFPSPPPLFAKKTQPHLALPPLPFDSHRPTSPTRRELLVTSTRPLPLEDLPTPRVSFLRRSVLSPSSPTPLSGSVSGFSSSRTERRSPPSFPTMVAL